MDKEKELRLLIYQKSKIISICKKDIKRYKQELEEYYKTYGKVKKYENKKKRF